MMIPVGLKIVVERTDGEITTWYETFNRRVEETLLEIYDQKGWAKGKVQEAYIEFFTQGHPYKVYLDCKWLTGILSTLKATPNENNRDNQ